MHFKCPRVSPLAVAEKAELAITANTIECKLIFERKRRIIRKLYPNRRKKKNFLKKHVIFKAIRESTKYAEYLRYHIITSVDPHQAEKFISRLRRYMQYYELNRYFTIELSFHEKYTTTRKHHLHTHILCYSLEDDKENLNDKIKKLTEIISKASKSDDISIIHVKSRKHAENITRYIFTPSIEKNGSVLAASIGRRPWAFINLKSLKNKASEAITRIFVSLKIANYVKQALANFFGNKLGRTPYFAKHRAGFKWLSWTYFKEDIKTIIKAGFTANGLPAPELNF